MRHTLPALLAALLMLALLSGCIQDDITYQDRCAMLKIHRQCLADAPAAVNLTDWKDQVGVCDSMARGYAQRLPKGDPRLYAECKPD